MKAVLLAAGEGKRMRPLTANRPKVLLPAGPEPLLGRLLRQLAAAGVDDITVVTHYKAEAVEKYVGDGARWNVRVSYAAQGAARGTGHAVAAAQPPEDEPFLILNGDVWLPEGALRAVVEAGPGALAAAHVADPRAYGVFELKNGRAVRVHEKSAAPPSTLANAGVYFAPAGFARLLRDLRPSPRGELELTDALQASFDAAGGWKVVEVKDWLDVGRPWDLLAAAERALAEMPEERRGTVEPGATLKGKVIVAEGALVKSGSYVEGPVYIGPRAVVGPNCYLRPNAVLLEDTKVGNGCEIKASLLMAGAHAAHLSYVGDSVLGERVNLGAGTLVANLRHDGKTVKVTQEGQRVDTGRRKMGVVLGDDVHTGINTSLNVGVMLPAGGATLPGEVVMTSRV
ncbi:MAG TPA: bifunctional sugar-1-phosphate nucleotidylyltransferase/acetyltransferase [Candidatus Thermoplasmatota archaeon]|nr:bifunctional sugar-1-phosphate nucleotidylyltransferase/acetyltransferase [Candidatus Thermoplasmatota archaeon]